MNLDELLTQWDSNKGKPFKGSLINTAAYAKDPGNPGCMCAQGQVLHFIGGYDVDQLAKIDQQQADLETAKLLDISVAHAILLREINDSADGAPSIVLTHPEQVIGDQADKVLAFWLYIDGMGANQCDAARYTAGAAAYNVACYATRNAASEAAGDAVGDAARYAAGAAACKAAGFAACYATWEIMGASVLRTKGQPFMFLPMFGFASPEDIV